MSLLRGVSWSYLESWGNKITSLLVFIILARLLEPKDFGLIAFAKLFIDYFDWVSGQGLDFALIQRKEVTDQHLNCAFWINFSFAGVLALVLYLTAPWIEFFFKVHGAATVLQVMTLMVLINALSRVQVAILLRNQQFKSLAVRGLAMAVIGGGSGIAFAVSGYGVWSLVYQQIVSVVVALLMLWKTSAWRPSMSFSLRAAKELYGFAAKVFLNQQVIFVSSRLDEALISVFLGVAALGYYSIAKRILEVAIDLIYSSLGKVLISIYSKIQNDLSAILEKTKRVNILMAAFSFPIFMLAASTHLQIVTLIFGEKWSQASLPFAILILSGIFLLAPNIIHSIFYCIGSPIVPLKMNVIRAIVSAVLISIGAYFGLLGVAAAVFFRNLAGAFIDFVYMRSELKCDITLLWRTQLSYALYCLPMVFSILIVDQVWESGYPAVIKLLLYGMTGMALYLITLKIFKADAIDQAKLIWHKFRAQREGIA